MIVLVDNYDSFTFNLYQYIGEFDRDIRVFRNDEIDGKAILEMNPDRVIISPGPKTPGEAGNCIEIIKTVGGKIPLMGVCLGHQSIAAAYGAVVTNAKELCHGKYSFMEHNGKGVFEGCPQPMQVARYHSLSVKADTLPDCLEVTAMAEGEIMALKHKEYDVIGLQFHPESINTPEGIRIIENFVKGGF